MRCARPGHACEAAICYTGDILNPSRHKYDLKYYVTLAKELEKLGTHILAIKDMAGLLKPYAAKILVKALRKRSAFPIHFHTHDSAGGQIASYMLAAEEGVDVVDCAFASMAGMTSQPSLNAFVEAMRFTERDPADVVSMRSSELRNTGKMCAKHYAPFETGQKAASAEVYLHEMPGGQYANLFQQAISLGLASAGTKSAGCMQPSISCSATS